MPVLPPGYPDAVSDVFTLIRAAMNDGATATGSLWTDARLLPFVASGYRALQRRLAASGITIVEADTEIVLPLGGLKLTTEPAGLDAALPSDFVWPKRLYEQGDGTSEKFVPMAYAYEQLPQRDQCDQLQVWDYVGDEVRFIGATRAVNIHLFYEKALPKLAAATDPIRIRDAVDCLAAYGASMAANSRGVGRAAESFMASFEAEARLVIKRGSKYKQRYPVRRRPYGSRSRAPY